MSTPAPSDVGVVVTGIGLWTALGATREETWRAMRRGESGARLLQCTDRAPRACFASESNPYGFAAPGLIVNAVVDEALEDALLPPTPGAYEPDRVAVVIGLSKGDLWYMARNHEAALTPSNEAGDDAWCFRDAWYCGWPNFYAALTGQRHGFRGPRLAPVAACATGVVAALRGADLIRRGAADIAVVGAGDSQLEPLVRAAFGSMRVLARGESDPRELVRPLERDRTGFLPGEGAAVLVLERADHARARGVQPYAVLCGGAIGGDGFHITNQDPDPTTLAHWIETALRRSDVARDEVTHVNLHATATRSNDPLECRAIRRVFGPHADALRCTANKSQIGHLLGAAGAAELAITCLSLRDQFVPPTLNLDHPDRACDLDATPHIGRPCAIEAALKISLGFGGHVAAAVVRKP